MKKSILLFCTVITAPVITVYGVNNWGDSTTEKAETSKTLSVITPYNPNYFANPFIKLFNSNFYYDVNSRFAATITKEKLHNATSIIDLVPGEGTIGLEFFSDVKIGVLTNGKDKIETGISSVLNPAQLDLLKSADYSTNYYNNATCKRNNSVTGKTEDYSFVYYVTIVPEKAADFKDGHNALMDYLKKNSKDETARVDPNMLQSGKVRFTVKQNGEIANVKLESTSGYATIDNTMIELITNMPGQWNPATNSKGEKVDQELVFSFGIIGF